MRSVFLPALLLITDLVFAAPQKVQILTDNNYRPYSFVSDNKAVGLYVEIVETVSSALPDYVIEVVPINWEEGKRQIKQGKALGLLSAYFHGHDWPYMYPYSHPIHAEQIVTVCNQNRKLVANAVWPNQYKGLLVAHVAGYDGWLGNNVRSSENKAYVNFIEVPNTDLALKMVVKGSANCALFEKVAFQFSLDYLTQIGEYNENTDHKPGIVSAIAREHAYIGYSEKALKANSFPFAYDFRKKFDATLHVMQRNGSFDDLYAKYLHQPNKQPAEKRFLRPAY